MTKPRPRPNFNMVNALMAEVTDLRELSDLLAAALRQGGIDRQWEAMTKYEQVRGLIYFQPTDGTGIKRAKRITPKSGNGFDCLPFQPKNQKPYDQDEEQE